MVKELTHATPRNLSHRDKVAKIMQHARKLIGSKITEWRRSEDTRVTGKR
jgi:hypothetical protein